MRSIRTIVQLALVMLLALLFNTQSQAWTIEGGPALPGDVGILAPTYPRCLDGCTAGEAQFLDAWLDSPSCTPPATTTATLNARLSFSVQRYCVVVVADIYVDGQLTELNRAWILDTAHAGTRTYDLGSVSWPCGSALELRDILIQWETANQACAYGDCARYTETTRCDQPADIAARAPLVAAFSATTACQKTDTQFTDLTSGGQPPYTYSWDFGDGSAASTAPNPTHTYTTAGAYQVTLTVTDSSNPKVSDTQSDAVTVDECCTLESAAVGVQLNYDPATCGSQATLTASLVGGRGPFTYQWYDGQTPIGATNPLQVTLAPGGHSLRVVVIDEAYPNCSVTSDAKAVTAVDQYPPAVACPADIAQAVDPGQCTALVGFVVNASDNCDIASVRYYVGATEIANPHAFPVGATTVRVEATDINGLTNECTFEVTITDSQAPSIACPANITANASQDTCQASVSVGQANATDNCAVASLAGVRSDSQALGAPYPAGVTTITWTAEDAAGNVAACAQTVTVNDNQAPTITCPGNITTSAPADTCAANVTFQATARDNCSIASIAYSVGQTEITSPHAFSAGLTTVAAVATDAQGNTSTCRFNVTVNDNQAPTITCPADIIQDAPAGQSGATVEVGVPQTSDNCAVAEITSARSDGKLLADPFPLGETTITWTAADAAGNKTSCAQVVTIQDSRPSAMTMVKSGPTVAADGDTVTYTFAVSNDDVNGDGGPITGLAVDDDLAGTATYVAGDDGDDALEVGETWTFSAQYTIQADDPNELVNTATATGQDGGGNTVTASDSHTLRLARAALGQPDDSQDPYCAGWLQGYTTVLTNTGAAELTNVTLAVQVPAGVAVNAASSSAGLVVDDATHAHWQIGTLQPGQALALYLEVRAPTSMAYQTLTTCFTLAAEPIDPIVKCEDSQVTRCEGPTSTPQPTWTPTVRPTHTPTPTATATPTITATPTATSSPNGRTIWLPLIRKSFEP